MKNYVLSGLPFCIFSDLLLFEIYVPLRQRCDNFFMFVYGTHRIIITRRREEEGKCFRPFFATFSHKAFGEI